MLPKIAELQINMENTTKTPDNGKSFLFDFKSGDFALQNGKMIEVEGIDSLKIWIQKTLLTEKNKYQIYKGTDYGVSLEDLIVGKYPTDFTRNEIQREITEALLINPNVSTVTNFNFNNDKDLLTVGFTVNHLFSLEVEI